MALDRSLAFKPGTWTLTGPDGKTIKPTLVHLKQKPSGPAGIQTRDHWHRLQLRFNTDLNTLDRIELK